MSPWSSNLESLESECNMKSRCAVLRVTCYSAAKCMCAYKGIGSGEGRDSSLTENIAYILNK